MNKFWESGKALIFLGILLIGGISLVSKICGIS